MLIGENNDIAKKYDFLGELFKSYYMLSVKPETRVTQVFANLLVLALPEQLEKSKIKMTNFSKK